LAGVNVFCDRGVKKSGVDVKLTEVDIHGGGNGEEETEARHADDRGEGLRVV
jgi:hypothetical protein